MDKLFFRNFFYCCPKDFNFAQIEPCGELSLLPPKGTAMLELHLRITDVISSMN